MQMELFLSRRLLKRRKKNAGRKKDMTGHLSLKELEGYKKADIQKLARELGVSDEGTIKEIAARCADVEVEVPEEELTEEERAELMQETGEEVKETVPNEELVEQARRETRERVEALWKEKDEAERAAGRVKVEVIERYLDMELGKIKEVGEVFYVDKSRAAVLLDKNLVKLKG